MGFTVLSDITRGITADGSDAQTVINALRATVYAQAHVADGQSISPDYLTPEEGSLLAQDCARLLAMIEATDEAAENE